MAARAPGLKCSLLLDELRVVQYRGRGYTYGMKTAVSLPDELFHAAERYARRLSRSRSRLYADAIAEYLARHAPDEVTEAMNRVVDRLGATAAEEFVAAAARETLERSEW